MPTEHFSDYDIKSIHRTPHQINLLNFPLEVRVNLQKYAIAGFYRYCHGKFHWSLEKMKASHKTFS